VVSIEKLTRRYGSFAAVHDMSLSIPDGCIFGLLGPNGAGKSTTVKCIAGILKPSAGRIVVDGIDASEQPVEVKKRIGYVPENPVLFSSLSGREVLLLAGRLHHIEEAVLHARIANLLESFGMTGKSNEQIKTYSKGMTQKIAIATALIHNPDLLILDEALNGLDAAAAAMMKRLLRGFADAGKSVVFCSHTLDVVERLCDEIAIMNEGGVCALGTVPAILARTSAATLEQAFMSLTGETDIAREASDILAALDSAKSS
jgi:ABC-2 type transport system ATP-binding protein